MTRRRLLDSSRWLPVAWPVLVAVAVWGLGCGGPTAPPTKAWRLAGTRPDGVRVVEPTLLFSGPRLRHLTGDPRWLYDGQSVPGTERPLALDWYAKTVFARMLDAHRDQASRTIVLGGALGLSCEGEWREFAAAMAPRTWLYTPGGGDGQAIGDGPLDDETWRRACAPGQPLPKDELVMRYLAHLSSLPLGAPRRPGRSGPWQRLDERPGLLLELQWNADADAPWRSYVVQLVDLTRPSNADVVVRAVLLDTEQLDAASNVVGRGDMASDQIAVVEEWLARRPNGLTILMGHHPVEALGSRARGAIEGWLDRGLAGLYVSSHGGSESYVEHEGAARRWLELGVGSSVDWPPTMRSLSFRAAESGTIALESKRLRAPAGWADPPLEGCDDAWRRDPDNADFDRSYPDLEGAGQDRAAHRLVDASLRHIMDERRRFASPPDSALLERIARTAGSFRPLAPKVALLAELTAQPPIDSERLAVYRDCQAQWASLRQRALLGVVDADEAVLLLPIR